MIERYEFLIVFIQHMPQQPAQIMDGKLGPVIDPTGGQKHLEQGVLHTVTPDPDRVLRDDGLRILRAARGEHGFGYDPLFVPDDQPERAAADHPLTSAEMDAAEKNAISHRGKAIKALVPAVEALLR